MYLSPRRNGDNLEVELSGSWRGSELPAIDAELGAVPLDGVAALRVRVPDTVPMDLAGAWRLRDWLEAAGHAGVSVSFEGTRPAQFDLIDASFTGKRRGPPASSSES